MPRQKKDATPVAIKMETEIYDRLADFCKETGQPKTTAIERAVNMYLNDYDYKQSLLDEKR